MGGIKLLQVLKIGVVEDICIVRRHNLLSHEVSLVEKVTNNDLVKF